LDRSIIAIVVVVAAASVRKSQLVHCPPDQFFRVLVLDRQRGCHRHVVRGRARRGRQSLGAFGRWICDSHRTGFARGKKSCFRSGELGLQVADSRTRNDRRRRQRTHRIVLRRDRRGGSAGRDGRSGRHRIFRLDVNAPELFRSEADDRHVPVSRTYD